MQMEEFYSGDHILPRKPPYYRTGEEPDVWFTPELVWEIRGAGKCSMGSVCRVKILEDLIYLWANSMRS